MISPFSTEPAFHEWKLRVLVLEDNYESRLLLTHLLRSDFETFIVGTADEALTFAKHNSVDLALLDINLGEQRTGLDVLLEMRKLPHFRHTPALACTAYALPGDREHFIESGFTGYVSKPFIKKNLIALMKETVEFAEVA